MRSHRQTATAPRRRHAKALARALAMTSAMGLLAGCFTSINLDRLADGGQHRDACAGSARDCEDTRDLDHDAGSDGGPDGNPLVCPEDMVRIESQRPFCIDRTEVSAAAYQAFLATGPGAGTGPCRTSTDKTPSLAWPPAAGHELEPVRGVTWCDAHAYCAWAGKRLCGKMGGGRGTESELKDPSTSEWAFACSGGGAHVYPYGDTYDGAACVGGGTTLGPVGTKTTCQGGFIGLFDLSGSVEEWVDACQDGQGATPMNDLCLAFGGGYPSTETGLTCGAAIREKRREPSESRGFRCCK